MDYREDIWTRRYAKNSEPLTTEGTEAHGGTALTAKGAEKIPHLAAKSRQGRGTRRAYLRAERKTPKPFHHRGHRGHRGTTRRRYDLLRSLKGRNSTAKNAENCRRARGENPPPCRKKRDEDGASAQNYNGLLAGDFGPLGERIQERRGGLGCVDLALERGAEGDHLSIELAGAVFVLVNGSAV